MRPERAGVLAAILLAGVAARGNAVELSECRLDAGTHVPTVKARCAAVEVAENPDSPDGAQIRLNVALVPSLSVEPQPDPLVLLAGGPGQAATEFYLAYAPAFERIRLERQILLVDQRGTGGSNPLDCDAQAQNIDSYTDPAVLIPAVEACLRELRGDPRYYTTSVAVRDLDFVRDQLGFQQLNLYGISYGTRVAQHYLRRYPQHTRSVILDGVVAAQVVLGPAIAIDAQNALDALFDRCASDPSCAERYPELPRSFSELYSRLSGEPVDVAVADPATGSMITRRLSHLELAGAVRLLSYSPTTLSILPLLLDAAWSENRYAPLAAQVILAERSLGESISTGMHNSVVCTEDAPFFDDTAVDETALAATYLGAEMLESIRTLCSVWPAGIRDDDFSEPLHSVLPVLLLSGENDPVTPPAYAELAAAGLENSVHIVGPAQGHGLAPLGCVPRVMADFVAAGSPDAIDASCVGRLAPMPFFVDFSGPAR